MVCSRQAQALRSRLAESQAELAALRLQLLQGVQGAAEAGVWAEEEAARRAISAAALQSLAAREESKGATEERGGRCGGRQRRARRRRAARLAQERGAPQQERREQPQERRAQPQERRAQPQERREQPQERREQPEETAELPEPSRAPAQELGLAACKAAAERAHCAAEEKAAVQVAAAEAASARAAALADECAALRARNAALQAEAAQAAEEAAAGLAERQAAAEGAARERDVLRACLAELQAGAEAAAASSAEQLRGAAVRLRELEGEAAAARAECSAAASRVAAAEREAAQLRSALSAAAGQTSAALRQRAAADARAAGLQALLAAKQDASDHRAAQLSELLRKEGDAHVRHADGLKSRIAELEGTLCQVLARLPEVEGAHCKHGDGAAELGLPPRGASGEEVRGGVGGAQARKQRRALAATEKECRKVTSALQKMERRTLGQRLRSSLARAALAEEHAPSAEGLAAEEGRERERLAAAMRSTFAEHIFVSSADKKRWGGLMAGGARAMLQELLASPGLDGASIEVPRELLLARGLGRKGPPTERAGRTQLLAAVKEGRVDGLLVARTFEHVSDEDAVSVARELGVLTADGQDRRNAYWPPGLRELPLPERVRRLVLVAGVAARRIAGCRGLGMRLYDALWGLLPTGITHCVLQPAAKGGEDAHLHECGREDDGCTVSVTNPTLFWLYQWRWGFRLLVQDERGVDPRPPSVGQLTTISEALEELGAAEGEEGAVLAAFDRVVDEVTEKTRQVLGDTEVPMLMVGSRPLFAGLTLNATTD